MGFLELGAMIMKTKFVALLAIVAVLGLAVAAYALNTSSATTTAKDENASCCKKDGACPMKDKMKHGEGHDKAEHHASGEKHSCCGDSCPMKAKDASGNAAAHNCECCGDRCPMKKKEDADATAVSTVAAEKNCCDDCECCKGKKDTAV
jgi:hypothetical protein